MLNTDCQDHVIFAPKWCLKVLYGELRRQLKDILREFARQKECQIPEGHLITDHVHLVLAIRRKHAASSVIGFLKGQIAIAIARPQGKKRNFTGEQF